MSDEAQLLAFHDFSEPLPPEAKAPEFTLLLEPEEPPQEEQPPRQAIEPQQEELAEEIDVEAEARRIFEEAFAQGERAGHEMGMKKVEPLVERLNSYLTSLDRFRQELLGRVERFATCLALAFAESIVLKECADHKEVTLAMIRKALEACEERSDILVRLPKEDAWMISAQETPSWKIIPDEDMKEPGFVIETRFGDIDGRISRQMEELKKEFLAAETERK